ncbi:hypothetical protein JCM8097_004614 [Rhodosporidiobolus ruineniae]
MPSTAQVRTAWLAVADSWTKDALRPQHQFSAAIKQAADRAFLASPAAAEQTGPQLKQLSPVQLSKAQEAAASLRRLLSNEAMKAYPASERTTKPASMPKHYSRILESVARAERGEVFKQPRFGWFRWK